MSCRGVAAMDIRTGEVQAILGNAVILASGGGGKIWPFTTNGNIKTGDGMALAYREGVPLKDMEFVQYHPTGLPGTGILLTEGCRGEGGILVNKDGYRYLQDYDLGKPDAVRRLGDRLTPLLRSPADKPKLLEALAVHPHAPEVHLERRRSTPRNVDPLVVVLLQEHQPCLGRRQLFEDVAAVAADGPSQGRGRTAVAPSLDVGELAQDTRPVSVASRAETANASCSL